MFQLSFSNDDKINALVNIIAIEHANKRPIQEDRSDKLSPPIIDIILKNSWYTVNELRTKHMLEPSKTPKRMYNPYAHVKGKTAKALID